MLCAIVTRMDGQCFIQGLCLKKGCRGILKDVVKPNMKTLDRVVLKLLLAKCISKTQFIT